MLPFALGRHRGVCLAASLLVSGLIPALLAAYRPLPARAAPGPQLSLSPFDTAGAAPRVASQSFFLGTEPLALHSESPAPASLSDLHSSGCHLTFVPIESLPLTASPSQVTVFIPDARRVDSASPSPYVSLPEPLSAGLITIGTAGLVLRKHLRRPTFRRA